MEFFARLLLSFIRIQLLLPAGALPRVHIISPGYFHKSDAPSLTYFEPALETGLEAVRRKYPHTNWTGEILHRASFVDCFSIRDNIQFELSKWYYTKASGEDVLTVIIAPDVFKRRLALHLVLANCDE
ncbi:hypothetical protein BV898_18824 [Hypsibius exemplaris]|uniref:Uncharacterized protein n=1 Tax=Hypsibius exemplaris TaxID=2072580 RepID=A0A9X6NHM3_HYPEX|nr:hypothetical protein BV898_18824 [Hypsibius exemplaris]